MRRRERWSLFVNAVVIGVAVITPRPATAACVRVWKDIPDAKRLSTLVFSGTVVSWQEGYDALDITFSVERVWKGHLRRRSVLPTYIDLDSYHLEPGERYLVFGGRVDASQYAENIGVPVFYVSQCGPTRTLAEARDTLKQLGRGHRPER